MPSLARRHRRRLVVCATGVAAALLIAGRPMDAQRPRLQTLSVSARALPDLRAWDTELERWERSGDLRLRRTDADPLMAGRTHERLDQYYKGIRVYGADLSRQTGDGVTVSMFGTLYANVDAAVDPAFGPDTAAAIVFRDCGAELGPAAMPQLWLLPEEETLRLVYRARAFSRAGSFEYFIDARDGTIVHRFDAEQRQSAVGTAQGVLGDAKKISVTASAGQFLSDDLLRPPTLRTYDMRENLTRTMAVLNGLATLNVTDEATDTDNIWTDGAVVDAHVYAGLVYDYYYRRFGRRGLDGNNLSVRSLVHPVNRDDFASVSNSQRGTYYTNAFYDGNGLMVYGEGLPPSVTSGGQHWNYLAGAIDIVGHELTHGVTEYTSNLIYRNESGALNESFSDMMGTAIEFFYQPFGSGPLKADYLCGEDVVTPGGLRSMAEPSVFGDPDHYSARLITALDNGGVHTNSSIGNQMYYLAIEGGTNRTSGLSVEGVGRANREQIEKVMYRAFTLLMPASATYAVARSVTIQAARDLYGANSPAERAVTQAWTAVGVN